jgi:excisionase family DNA binding protein
MTHHITITYQGPGDYYLTGPRDEEYIILGEIESEEELVLAVREAVLAGSGEESWQGWQTVKEEQRRNAEGPRLYTTASLAQFLGVSVHTIRNEIKRGKLPQRMVGRAYRFTEDDVEEYLRKR